MASEKIGGKDEICSLSVPSEGLTQANELAYSGEANVPQNHSTHCEGLPRIIAKLKKRLPSCTIIAGELSRGNNHSETFELRYQREIGESVGTKFKFVARNGHTCQDVKFSVSNKYHTLEVIQQHIKDAIEEVKAPRDFVDPYDESLSLLSNKNRELGKQADIDRRIRAKAEDEKTRQKEKEARKNKKINRIQRQIRNKNVGKANKKALALQFYEIENEGKKGRNAYKCKANGQKHTPSQCE